MRSLTGERLRRGFTLIEMLIASAIFIVGFVSVYGLFLAGTRMQRQSSAHTASALAANTLIGELRLRCGLEDAGPYPPRDYNGDGDPQTPDDAGLFVPYADDPTIWYRFSEAQDIQGLDTSTDHLCIRLQLDVIDLGMVPSNQDGSYELTVQDLADRLGIDRTISEWTEHWPFAEDDQKEAFLGSNSTPMSPEERQLFVLRQRGLLLNQEVIVYRRHP